MPQSVRRWIVVAVAISATIYQYFFSSGQPATIARPATVQTSSTNTNQSAAIKKIQTIIDSHDFNAKFWTNLSGDVVKVLKDDREGDMHQRFLLKVTPDLTLLVAHNIDIAKRVPVQEKTRITVQGEYVWNDKGGVLHWTHRDPRGRKQGGWIDYQGQRYE